MNRTIFGSSGGFTYIAVLVIVVITGILAAALGESMSMISKREREEELLFRGGQIQDALERWYNLGGPKSQQKRPNLRDLKDLLQDPTSPANVRHLRRLYKDPMTPEGEWQVISDPNRGIIGVASTSDKTPIKQANFPEKWKYFEGKTKYSDWVFVPQGLQPQGTTTIPTTSSPR